MVRIICDSSNSLPEDTINRLNIIEVPALVNIPTASGIKSYRNKIELSIEDFYKILLSSSQLPTTSQPTPQHFVDAFSSVDPVEEILCITVSSKLSGTHQSAVMGATLVNGRRIVVWDGLGGSMDSGWQAIVAGEMALRGETVANIVAALPQVRANSHTFFTTETLKYLAASGRVPRLSASIGNLLNVKPILHFKHDGTIDPVARVRGRQRSFDALLEQVKAAVGNEPVRAAVVNSNSPAEAEVFGDEVKRNLNIIDLEVIEVGPVLGALAGPGMIGLSVYKPS